MYVCGFASATSWPLIAPRARTLLARLPVKRSRCFVARRSRQRKPRLWRVAEYSSPGFPSPTISVLGPISCSDSISGAASDGPDPRPSSESIKRDKTDMASRGHAERGLIEPTSPLLLSTESIAVRRRLPFGQRWIVTNSHQAGQDVVDLALERRPRETRRGATQRDDAVERRPDVGRHAERVTIRCDAGPHAGLDTLDEKT